jgi:predicted SnoaL-like aldol condensation-catalyzing enzyme
MADDARSNKEVVRRFIRDGRDRETGRWNMEVIAEVFDLDRYFSHSWGAGLAETGRRMGEYFSAFEFVEMLNEDFVAEDDFVVRRATSRVRHVGEVFGVAATNRVITVHTVEMWRLANGKIVEHWGGAGDGRNLYAQITAAEPE